MSTVLSVQPSATTITSMNCERCRTNSSIFLRESPMRPASLNAGITIETVGWLLRPIRHKAIIALLFDSPMKPYFALACIVLAGIVPFSSRAVSMDEHIYLRIAETAQHNWLFPQDSPSVFFGLPTTNDVAITHPPVGQYYLALEYRLFGRFSEVPFRLLFAVFPVAAVLAFYPLARRFTKQPFLIAVLLALSPAFFVTSPTLMMDMPMIAFLLAGIVFYFRHLEGRRLALIAATLCWILSGGTGYTALVPLGCLFVQMILQKRPSKELLAVAATPMT